MRHPLSAGGQNGAATLNHYDPTVGVRRTSRSGWLLLAFGLLCALVTLAVLLPSRQAVAPRTFVDRALGAPSSDASLERRLATGATLSVDARGIDAHVGTAAIALASRGVRTGAWQRYRDGASRATSFGRESILFGINRAEQFLTVDRHQGARMWSWQLDATNGMPRLGPDGGVTFTRAGRLVGLHILPVAILDRHGRDVTPAGLQWSLDRQGSRWILGLRLDDRRLPVPYLIDPIVLIAACVLPVGPGGTTSCTAATSTGSSSLGITKPSAAVNGDVMVAQVTVRSTGAITPPGGWNQIGTTTQDAGGPIEQAVYWHLVDGTEPGTVTFTWAGGPADASGGLVTYKGVDPFVGFDQGGSAVTSMNSGGTGASGNPAGLAITTTAANEMVQAAYGVANGVTITQSAGQTLTREWSVASTGGTKVTAGFSDGVKAAAGASGNKTATWVTSSLWAAHLFALKNEAADGSGTVLPSFTTASASETGLTQTLTFTPAAGSMANGDVSFVVPAGWTAPQASTPTGAGYVTASGGSGTNSIAVTGSGPWTVTVSGVTLDQGAAQTLVMTYGDTTGGGPGATATSATGAATWTTKGRSSSRGTLTNIGASPSVTVYAADGTGAMASSLSAVSGSQAGLTETLTYTVAAGNINNGSITVDVPAGWTPPATVAGPGFTTANFGVVSVSGQTITVSGITRNSGQTVVITYGSGATATAAAGPGAQTWQVKEASTAGGVVTAIGTSPTVTIYAPDGAGAADHADDERLRVADREHGRLHVHGRDRRHVQRRRQADDPGGVERAVDESGNAGYTTSSAGALTVAARVVTVASLSLAAGSTVTITYGERAAAEPGATATATTGAQTWQLQEHVQPPAASSRTSAASPSITVNAKNGAGTLTASIGNVSASQTGQTITFTYTAAAGDMVDGAVTVTAPAGWSAPSTTTTDPGYTTASTGAVSAAGQTVTVSGVTLTSGSTMTIVYGDTGGGGPGATAGSTVGAQTWQAQESSTSGGVLANLAASPSITVYAADGSGTDVASISVVSAGQTGRVVTLTYTPATGGMLSGTVTVVVPSGWTPPSTVAGPGFSTANVGLAHRLRPDDHRHRGDAHRRADTDHHVRLRQQCDGSVDTRRADVAGAGGVDRSGCPHLDRVAAGDHRLRGRRLGDDGRIAGRRLGLADRDDAFVHVHGGHRRHERRHDQRHRPRRLERAVDDGQRRRVFDGHRRHGHRRGSHDHRLQPDARGRRHRDDHVRRQERQRPRRDGDERDRRRDVDRAGALDRRRRAHEPRLVAVDHGLCGERHRNDDGAAGERRQRLDRQHPHVHVHRGRGRNVGRRRDRRRACRLERAVDDGNRSRLHDRVDRHRLGRGADDHRQRRHARRRRDDDGRLREHGRQRARSHRGHDRRCELVPDAAAFHRGGRAGEHRVRRRR